jgi:hypothetical protein
MKFEHVIKLYAVVVVINFAAFVIAAVWLGGDAINGHSGNGHYYVCGHGSCSEVGRAVFTYSWWHAFSVIVTFAAFFAALAMQKLHEYSN